MSEYVVDFGDKSSAFVGLAIVEAESHGATLKERVVRCSDCKHATPDTSGRKCYEGYLWCDELTEGIGFSVAPSDFCAWGERRDA